MSSKTKNDKEIHSVNQKINNMQISSVLSVQRESSNLNLQSPTFLNSIKVPFKEEELKQSLESENGDHSPVFGVTVISFNDQ